MCERSRRSHGSYVLPVAHVPAFYHDCPSSVHYLYRVSSCNLTSSRGPTERLLIGECAVWSVWSAPQGMSLTAGKRLAGCGRLPLGRPGDHPQGFGTFAELPRCTRSDEKPRRTRAGERRSGGSGRCQGKHTSATWSRAKRSWTKARTSSQVQRSAAAGARSLGVVHFSVFVKKPSRIVALSLVMVWCLLVYRLAEHRLRSQLAATGQTIPN